MNQWLWMYENYVNYSLEMNMISSDLSSNDIFWMVIIYFCFIIQVYLNLSKTVLSTHQVLT